MDAIMAHRRRCTGPSILNSRWLYSEAGGNEAGGNEKIRLEQKHGVRTRSILF